jgi:magnesium transporter
MNFQFMPELSIHWAYPVVLGIMVAICLILYRAFRNRNWL